MGNKQKSTLQLIWGILLLIAGVGVFFRIPQVMPEIKKIEHFAPYMVFIYFCFGRKVYRYTQQSKQDNSND
jgi:hypothetical protein